MTTRLRHTLAFSIAATLSLLAGPGCRRAGKLPPAPALAEPAATPAAPAPSRPAPGADLPGQPAPPPPASRRPPPGAPARPLDLGADRSATRLPVPAPPRGGAVGFTIDEQRRGWATRIPESLQLPAVAYGGGRIYVSGGFETYSLYALDAEEGNILWASAQLPDNGPTAPLYEDDRVIFDTESCTLVALDARTGKLLWSNRLGDPTLAQPALAGGLVFASHPGGRGYELSAYRAATGAHVWSQPVASELYAAPVVDGDSVYATAVGGQTYRFARRDGRPIWSRPLRATTAPFVADGELFLSRRASGGEAEVVVSAATGAILRTHAAIAAPYLADVPRDVSDWKALWAFEGSRPVVARGVRYVARGGMVEAADTGRGAAYWIRRDGSARGKRSVGTVALAGSQVVVSTRAGEVYGLDVDTGYTLWAYDVGHPVIAEPVVARGWVYVATADGLVVALEVADPSLDGWHMFGGNPRHNGPVG